MPRTKIAENEIAEVPETRIESEAELRRQEISFKKVLDAQRKVEVRVPIDQLSKEKEQKEFIGINGIHYWIPRGKTVEVPESVAKILEDAGRI